jgi:hypothetical protein
MYVCTRASVYFAQGSIQLNDDQEIIQIQLIVPPLTTTTNFGVVQGMIPFAKVRGKRIENSLEIYCRD